MAPDAAIELGKLLAMLAEWLAAGAGFLVLRFDVVSLRALGVVVVHGLLDGRQGAGSRKAGTCVAREPAPEGQEAEVVKTGRRPDIWWPAGGCAKYIGPEK